MYNKDKPMKIVAKAGVKNKKVTGSLTVDLAILYCSPLQCSFTSVLERFIPFFLGGGEVHSTKKQRGNLLFLF